jgi:hypothetical protein
MDKKTIKAIWMKKFEQGIASEDSTLKGHIDWDTANYLYTTDLTLRGCIDKYIKTFSN